ncbi:hypothetical protein L7F22_046119 [Adiantum nelumboides]|nr:hypothetical protein [Adiantum nelumboides]
MDALGRSLTAVFQVNMAGGVDVVASDWNNRIRDAVMKVSAKIPEVGSVVSALIGYLWPENKVNIFQAIKADLTKLVKQEILHYELKLHESELDTLKKTMEGYKTAKTHEKGLFLHTWITEAQRLSAIFRGSTNNIHLILPVITLALLHLTGLRERLDFGKELYQEDNRKQWKEDLEVTYKMYIVDFLPNGFKKWKVWRADQVNVEAWTKAHPMALPPFFRIESYATVVDTITGEKKYFSADLTDSTTVFTAPCKDHKVRMCNDATAAMAGHISATFVFDKILPDNSKNLPKYDKVVFGRVFKGPYSQDLCLSEQSFGMGYPLKDLKTSPNQDDYSPSSGPITKVIIR